MRTFSKSTLRAFWIRNAAAEGPLDAWYSTTEKASWKNFGEVRNDFPAADKVGKNVIFDVGGNNYRLIGHIDYRRQGVFVLWVGTHAEYDRLTSEEIKSL